MTKEEAIKESIKVLKIAIEDSKEQNIFCFSKKGIEALDMAIKALEQTRWIPVNERLPEEDGMYLISTCMNCIDTCLFYKDDDEYVWVDYEDSVRAWMPLPEPYKAEGEE